MRQGKVVAEGAWEEHEQLRGGRWATKNLDSKIFIFAVRVRREIAEKLKKEGTGKKVQRKNLPDSRLGYE